MFRQMCLHTDCGVSLHSSMSTQDAALECGLKPAAQKHLCTDGRNGEVWCSQHAEMFSICTCRHCFTVTEEKQRPRARLCATDQAVGRAHAPVGALRRRGAGAVASSTSRALVRSVGTVGEAVAHQAGVHTLAAATLIQVGGALSPAAC